MKTFTENDWPVIALLNTYNKTIYLTLKIKDLCQRHIRALKDGMISIELEWLDGIIFIKVCIGVIIVACAPFNMSQYPKFKLQPPGLSGYVLKILLLDMETSKLQTTHTIKLGHQFSSKFFTLARQQWKCKPPNVPAIYQTIPKRLCYDITSQPLQVKIRNSCYIPIRYTKEEMIEKSRTEALEYIVFGERISDEIVLPDSCLSPYHSWEFRYNKGTYYNVIQMLAIWKALFLSDMLSFKKIRETANALQCKELYGQITGKKLDDWECFESGFMVKGYFEKFTQNESLKKYLLATGDKILVYASPDTNWGIGMSAKNPNTTDPSKWRGSNLVGCALMDARQMLKEDEKIIV